MLDLQRIIDEGAYDLHMHTTASDGVYSPSELVNKMKEWGKNTIAITDHDTMAGIKEATEEGEKIGVTVIPGVELTTYLEKERIDILGYGLKETAQLKEVLQKIRDHRERRAFIIIEKFQQIGINITIEDVKEFSQGGVIARPHIAKAVVAKGYIKDMQTVFDHYLADGKPCSIEKLQLTPQEGIELIHEAGGLAVLAHPAVLKNQKLIDKLLSFGFDGIEVHHPLHSPQQEKTYRKYGVKYNLLMTGGSDFHG